MASAWEAILGGIYSFDIPTARPVGEAVRVGGGIEEGVCGRGVHLEMVDEIHCAL